MTNAMILGAIAKHTRGVIFSLALGISGGALCGAAILSFIDLAGRSGTTGEEYVGYWSIGDVWVGFMYGAPLGAIVAPLVYATLVRTIGFRRAIFPATLGTLAGGIGGGLVHPLLSQITGVAGFFIALVMVRYPLLGRSTQ
jgi:uncharacterized membrane protein